MCAGKIFRGKQPYRCQSSWLMRAYGRWPVRRPVGLTKPAQSPERPRKEYAGISGSEPTCPACDPAIVHFPGALPNDGRSLAATDPAPYRDRTRTTLPFP